MLWSVETLVPYFHQRRHWDKNPCQTELSRICVPPLKQTFAFTTHLLVYQITPLQSALLWKKNLKKSVKIVFSAQGCQTLLWPQSTWNTFYLDLPFVKRALRFFYHGFYQLSTQKGSCQHSSLIQIVLQCKKCSEYNNCDCFLYSTVFEFPCYANYGKNYFSHPFKCKIQLMLVLRPQNIIHKFGLIGGHL